MNINFKKYFNQQNGHGNGLIIKGGVRKGKTTLIGMIVKELVKENFAIISNVRFKNSVYEKYSNIYYINNAYDYFVYYAKIPYSTPILLIWDDAQAQSGLTSLGVNTKEGRKLNSFMVFIGKFQTSFIYVAHKSYIPRTLIEGFEPLFIYKIEKKSFYISPNFHEIDTNVINDRQSYYVDMPNIKDRVYYLDILSIAFADFKFDNIDLALLFDKLSSYEVGENIKEAVQVYLDENSKDFNYEITNLKKITYEQLYLSLCLKRGYIIPTGEKLNNLITDKQLYSAQAKLKNLGLNHPENIKQN